MQQFKIECGTQRTHQRQCAMVDVMGADTKTELTLRDSCKERTSFGRVLAPALDTIGQPRGPTELCCTLHCRQCKERFACNFNYNRAEDF